MNIKLKAVTIGDINGIGIHLLIKLWKYKKNDLYVILFIYRQHVYTESDEDKGMGEIIIAKHRNGPTGVAKVTFIDEYARFENYEFSDRISEMPFS